MDFAADGYTISGMLVMYRFVEDFTVTMSSTAANIRPLFNGVGSDNQASPTAIKAGADPYFVSSAAVPVGKGTAAGGTATWTGGVGYIHTGSFVQVITEVSNKSALTAGT